MPDQISRNILDRLRALGIDDPEIVREVRGLERIAIARSIHIATNGKFPHWSIDRWITVIGFLGMLAGGIWFGGARWNGLTTDVAALQTDITALGETVKSNKDSTDHSLEQIRREILRRPMR